MKGVFVRGLWGIYAQTNELVKRRYKMDADIKETLGNRYAPPFVTYVYGDENYKYLRDLGVKKKDLKLISKDPYKFNLSKEQYRHKLEIYKLAMEDYGEFIYIDWDVVAKKELPNNFWELMGRKEYVQANLQQYKRRKCQWRKVESRKVPNGGFLYIRDKDFPDEIIDCWENKTKGNSDEPAIARAMDDRFGGWMGMKHYWKNHEPMFCNLWKYSAFDKDYLKHKRGSVCFIHNQGLPSYRYVKKEDRI